MKAAQRSRFNGDKQDRCFACGRKLGKKPALVTCADEQDIFVGSECFKLIKAAGSAGYQPVDGPRLYTLENDPKGARNA